jgi:regulator of PEP synthase PpsR (kinase-PPPase family)
MCWERLADLADRWQMHTIDTSHLSREEVADEVLEWCRRALDGDAPALQVRSA